MSRRSVMADRARARGTPAQRARALEFGAPPLPPLPDARFCTVDAPIPWAPDTTGPCGNRRPCPVHEWQ